MRRSFLLFLLLNSLISSAQDIQFTQSYAVDLYLNPAFAGIRQEPRLAFHQRIQWPGLEARYITSLLSFDTYFEKHRSSIGGYLIQDFQGVSTLSSTELQLQYSYEFAVAPALTIRTGLQAGLVTRSINFSRARFPDQYDHRGYTGNTSDQIAGMGNRILYPDFSTGLLVFSPFFWGGLSFHHLNTPRTSFSGAESQLPLKVSFIAGYRYDILKKKHTPFGKSNYLYLVPTVHYKFQGKSDQLDFGVYGIYSDIIGGIWYRGIPIKKYQPQLHNNESLAFLAGYKYQNWKFSYSYDIVVSELTPARTAGAHELHIEYTFTDKHQRRKKPRKRLPCPDI